jgi:hypothetical protein
MAVPLALCLPRPRLATIRLAPLIALFLPSLNGLLALLPVPVALPLVLVPLLSNLLSAVFLALLFSSQRLATVVLAQSTAQSVSGLLGVLALCLAALESTAAPEPSARMPSTVVMLALPCLSSAIAIVNLAQLIAS